MTGKYLVDLNSPACFIPPIEIVCFQHRHLYPNLLISVFEGFIPFKDFFCRIQGLVLLKNNYDNYNQEKS